MERFTHAANREPVALSDRPTLVYFKLFDNCNLRCQMCDCWELPRARLPLAHYERVLRAVLTARPRAIRFTGGEPLLFRALPALLEQAAAAGVRVAMITNGMLLERRLGDVLDAGLHELVVSIDGPADAHDRIRGMPSFEGVRRGLELVPRDIILGVNTVVQHDNADHLWPVLELLASLPSPPVWWHLIPVRNDGLLAPTLRQRDAFRDVFAALRGAAAGAGISLVATAEMFDKGVTSCSVPQFVVYVDAVTGDVFGCNMLAYVDAAVGNLQAETLREILGSEPISELRYQCSAAKKNACSRCDSSSRLMNELFRSHYEGRLGR